jgi:hypothetical protein
MLSPDEEKAGATRVDGSGAMGGLRREISLENVSQGEAYRVSGARKLRALVRITWSTMALRRPHGEARGGRILVSMYPTSYEARRDGSAAIVIKLF